jgi:hypothetical protein
MKKITLATILTVIISTTGCVRTRVPVASGVTGQIIDKQTEEPIPNTKVYFSEYPEISVVSDEKGIFELRTHFEKRWVPALPIDFIPPKRDITVIGNAGYETKIVPPHIYDEVVVELEKSEGPYKTK